MEEKKLTDEEVIKALECCINSEGCDCGNCSYNNNDDCQHRSGEDLLELIHRLKSENEDLKAKQKCHLELIDDKNEEICKQKAEIERLTEKCAYQRLELCKEIAVLKMQVDKWTVTASKWFERELELEGAAKQAVKDTAKKFAEMADKKIAQCQGERDGYEAFTIDDKAKYDGDIVSLALFEICKEITGVKENGET